MSPRGRRPPPASILAVVLAAVLLLAPRAGLAAPKAELWERWNAHDEASNTVVNHGAWEAFLVKYVVAGDDGINRIRYGAVDMEDGGRLALYIQDLSRVAVSKLRRDEQRVFWINLYNAYTVKTIVDRYPVSSILVINISPGLFTKGPWGAQMIKVEDETLSLDDIEHRILRPIWKDPRTHYAVNCASLGCPNIAPHAYTAASMEQLLDAGARAYVNHPRGAHVENGKLRVSSLYDWYQDDFGGNDAGVIEHLKKYASPELAAQLEGIRKISGDDYDWSLNDVR